MVMMLFSKRLEIPSMSVPKRFGFLTNDERFLEKEVIAFEVF